MHSAEVLLISMGRLRFPDCRAIRITSCRGLFAWRLRKLQSLEHQRKLNTMSRLTPGTFRKMDIRSCRSVSSLRSFCSPAVGWHLLLEPGRRFGTTSFSEIWMVVERFTRKLAPAPA